MDFRWGQADKVQEHSDRAERDQKVDDILAQANVPILHFPAQAAYSAEEIQKRIFGEPEAGGGA